MKNTSIGLEDIHINQMDTQDTISNQLPIQNPICIMSQLKKLTQNERQQILDTIMKEENDEKLKLLEQQAHLEQQSRLEQQAHLEQQSRLEQQAHLEQQSRLEQQSPLYNANVLNSIMYELRCLRLQVQDLKYNNYLCSQKTNTNDANAARNKCKLYGFSTGAVNDASMFCNYDKYCKTNNDTENTDNSNICNMNENVCNTDDTDICRISIFSFEWMPFWIFIAFILFAFTTKPRFTSISSSISDSICESLNNTSSGISSISKCPLEDFATFCTRL